mmetsp:Transcript_101690/g.292893  ORF Transcript_101690/g.292893 Transcript_101690/m.292893 type:complete len:421 (+) Transcript_101690:594-1856(+)
MDRRIRHREERRAQHVRAARLRPWRDHRNLRHDVRHDNRACYDALEGPRDLQHVVLLGPPRRLPPHLDRAARVLGDGRRLVGVRHVVHQLLLHLAHRPAMSGQTEFFLQKSRVAYHSVAAGIHHLRPRLQVYARAFPVRAHHGPQSGVAALRVLSHLDIGLHARCRAWALAHLSLQVQVCYLGKHRSDRHGAILLRDIRGQHARRRLDQLVAAPFGPRRCLLLLKLPPPADRRAVDPLRQEPIALPDLGSAVFSALHGRRASLLQSDAVPAAFPRHEGDGPPPQFREVLLGVVRRDYAALDRRNGCSHQRVNLGDFVFDLVGRRQGLGSRPLRAVPNLDPGARPERAMVGSRCSRTPSVCVAGRRRLAGDPVAHAGRRPHVAGHHDAGRSFDTGRRATDADSGKHLDVIGRAVGRIQRPL